MFDSELGINLISHRIDHKEDNEMEQPQTNQNQVEQQVLERAVRDMEFRQLLLNDPVKAVTEVVGREPKQAVVDQQHRQLLERVLDRAGKDSQFLYLLEQDPQQAMQAAGFGEEYQQIQEKRATVAAADALKRDECFLYSIITYQEW